MLELNSITVRYGKSTALSEVDINVSKKYPLVAVLGANGAGKSTLLRTISGLVSPCKGSIVFQGRDITRMPPDKRVKAGLSQVPERKQVFPSLTVKENLFLGAYSYYRKESKEFEQIINSVYDMFPILKNRSDQKAVTLSGGEQRMLSIGRAMMSDPVIYMLDEPSMGLAPIIANMIFDAIKKLSEEGKAILIVEQDTQRAMKLADYVYVLRLGEVVMEGPARSIDYDKVIGLYMGD